MNINELTVPNIFSAKTCNRHPKQLCRSCTCCSKMAYLFAPTTMRNSLVDEHYIVELSNGAIGETFHAEKVENRREIVVYCFDQTLLPIRQESECWHVLCVKTQAKCGALMKSKSSSDHSLRPQPQKLEEIMYRTH